MLRTLTQWPDEHLPREVTVAPHTLLVGGGFVVPSFRLAVPCVRHRSGKGVPNGPATFLLSEVVIKAGGWSGAWVKGNAGGVMLFCLRAATVASLNL